MARLLVMEKEPFTEDPKTGELSINHAGVGWHVVTHYSMLRSGKCDHKESICTKCYASWAKRWYLLVERDDGTGHQLGELFPREAIDTPVE